MRIEFENDWAETTRPTLIIYFRKSELYLWWFGYYRSTPEHNG